MERDDGRVIGCVICDAYGIVPYEETADADAGKVVSAGEASGDGGGSR